MIKYNLFIASNDRYELIKYINLGKIYPIGDKGTQKIKILIELTNFEERLDPSKIYFKGPKKLENFKFVD